MFEALARAREIPPVRWVFVASLLLSLVAFSQTVTIGKDAALYLYAAQVALEQGPRAAFEVFDWPWFSFLLAAIHGLSGFSLEAIAYTGCALLIAGSSSLLVAVSERHAPGSANWAGLVVLALPAINQFRNDIIREHGFWFFSLLALVLALRWLESGGWRKALQVQLAIVVAALFRLEAVLLMPSIAACLITQPSRREGWKRLLQLTALPLGGVLLVIAAAWYGDILNQPRIAYYVSLLDPGQLTADLDVMAKRFAAAALEKYSADDAIRIVVFGVFLAIVFKFLLLNGPLILPLLHSANWPVWGNYRKHLSPFFFTWLAYLAVLFVFFFRQRFINARYVSFLCLLVVPLLAAGCAHFSRLFPRGSKVLVAAAAIVMLSGVVATGAKKTHYIEAAAWLSSHSSPTDTIYYEDARIAYYAGRGYPRMSVSGEQLMTTDQSSRYRYLVLTPKAGDALLQSLTGQGKPILAEFSNRKGDRVVVVGH